MELLFPKQADSSQNKGSDLVSIHMQVSVSDRGEATLMVVGAQAPIEIWKTTIKNKFSPWLQIKFLHI